MMEGTQSPTKIPASDCPLNHKETDSRNDTNAAIKKILSDFFMLQNNKEIVLEVYV